MKKTNKLFRIPIFLILFLLIIIPFATAVSAPYEEHIFVETPVPQLLDKCTRLNIDSFKVRCPFHTELGGRPIDPCYIYLSTTDRRPIDDDYCFMDLSSPKAESKTCLGSRKIKVPFIRIKGDRLQNGYKEIPCPKGTSCKKQLGLVSCVKDCIEKCGSDCCGYGEKCYRDRDTRQYYCASRSTRKGGSNAEDIVGAFMSAFSGEIAPEIELVEEQEQMEDSLLGDYTNLEREWTLPSVR